MQENGNDYAIKSVMKAVQMLKLVASNSPATFTELLEQSPFPKATAFRLIYTLEAAGLIECRDGKYVLSSLLLELGLNAKNQLGFGSISRGLLESLGKPSMKRSIWEFSTKQARLYTSIKLSTTGCLEWTIPLGFRCPRTVLRWARRSWHTCRRMRERRISSKLASAGPCQSRAYGLN